MRELNNEAKVVYIQLLRYLKVNGYMPTRKELVKNSNISSYKVQGALQELEKCKLIKIKPRAARAIQLNGYTLTPIARLTGTLEEILF